MITKDKDKCGAITGYEYKYENYYSGGSGVSGGSGGRREQERAVVG